MIREWVESPVVKVGHVHDGTVTTYRVGERRPKRQKPRTGVQYKPMGSNRRRVVMCGVEYDSISACSLATGATRKFINENGRDEGWAIVVDVPYVRRATKSGAMVGRRPNPVTVGGVVYESAKAAAVALGRSEVWVWRNRERTGDR